MMICMMMIYFNHSNQWLYILSCPQPGPAGLEMEKWQYGYDGYIILNKYGCICKSPYIYDGYIKSPYIYGYTSLHL